MVNIFKNIFLFIIIIFLCGCATLGVYNSATQQNEFIFINDATEIAIGKNVSQQMMQTKKLWYDGFTEARIVNIGRRVAGVSDRTNINYEFYCLDTDELNAMALPGGIVYVNKGLVNKLNDAEMAFIVGHEVGHIAAKHSVKKVQANLGFQLLLAVAFAFSGQNQQNSATTIADVSSQIYNLIALGYNRQDEYFADKLGVKYAYRAGYDPYAAVTALEKLKKGESENVKVLEYLRTHPYTDDRIKAVKELIPQLTNAANYRAQ
jgi:predicted Zn-dependent protease